MAKSGARYNEYAFGCRERAAAMLSNKVSDALQEAIRLRGRAYAVVSGGSTPRYMYRLLSRVPLRWENVFLILSDERWVPVDSVRSNENLIRKNLMGNNACCAELLSMYRKDCSPESAAEIVSDLLNDFTEPLDTVVLGMGIDGHIASIFPGAPNLESAITGQAPCTVQDLRDLAETRLSLSLPFLLKARQMNLLFFGEDKKRMFEQALLKDLPGDYPVAAILHRQEAPTNVYWAP